VKDAGLYLPMLTIGDIEPLCDWTLSTGWNNVAASWIQSQLNELQFRFGRHKKHFQQFTNTDGELRRIAQT
jgi:hypothetical protein